MLLLLLADDEDVEHVHNDENVFDYRLMLCHLIDDEIARMLNSVLKVVEVKPLLNRVDIECDVSYDYANMEIVIDLYDKEGIGRDFLDYLNNLALMDNFRFLYLFK